MAKGAQTVNIHGGRDREDEGRWFVESPLGRVCLRARGEVVTGLSFEGVGEAVGEELPVVRRARTWVEDYFRGRFRPPDFAIAPRGTPFQLRVWSFVREFAVGEMRSYGEVAAVLGCGSARAVGQALGRNPLLLLIPCHRVIGAHGQLGGYAGGLARKRALLVLEGGICSIVQSAILLFSTLGSHKDKTRDLVY